MPFSTEARRLFNTVSYFKKIQNPSTRRLPVERYIVFPKTPSPLISYNLWAMKGYTLAGLWESMSHISVTSWMSLGAKLQSSNYLIYYR